jgi:hypothetical protein
MNITNITNDICKYINSDIVSDINLTVTLIVT